MNYRVRRMLGLEDRPRTAAVLGCGPAGLFAAHGLIEAGWNVRIYSKKRKSHMYGAQYLHAPIRGLTPDGEEPQEIRYTLTGAIDGYRDKVYGSTPVQVSPQTLNQLHQSWDIRAAYDRAWDLYEPLINDVEIGPQFLGIGWFSDGPPDPVHEMLALPTFDLIVSTIPLPELCYRDDEHLFHSTQIWAIGDAPDRGQFAPYRPDENTVVCDGTSDVGWYRAANVRGHCTVEWPGKSRPPLPDVAPVYKPLYTDCNCYRDGRYPVKFVPLGRYGAWSKSVLSHHAYTQAAQL